MERVFRRVVLVFFCRKFGDLAGGRVLGVCVQLVDYNMILVTFA